MNYAAVEREDGSMIRTVSGPVSVVPRHGAAFVGARCGDSMGSAVNAFPYGDLASAKVHDGATAWLDVGFLCTIDWLSPPLLKFRAFLIGSYTDAQ